MMMDRPLLISGIIAHATRYHGDTEIVSRLSDRSIHRYDYARAEHRAKQCAQALRRLGIKPGDRAGTLAWNSFRHLELYYGISGIGSVCHTINPRLFVDQLRYIVNHAEDRVIFLDATFLPLVEKLAPDWRPVEHYVLLCARAEMPAATSLPSLLCYEDLIEAESGDLAWPALDERTASSLCYTSGTTGNPKGALYSHRSTVLHALTSCMSDMLGINSADAVCPIVPMFHVNAWGTPYSGPIAGAKMVFPGQHLDGESLCDLFTSERVTCSLGVPTVWLGMLRFMDEKDRPVPSLKRIVVGGSAAPPSMIETFEKRWGIRAVHAWGMTEMSPLGSVANLKEKHKDLTEAEQDRIKCTQGRPCYGVDMKIVDSAGRLLPHDGVAMGELMVRGPWIISGYYKDPEASAAAFDAEGWFKTGDVSVIDPDGFMTITDRSKDVIKSGGEWISSIDIENAAMAHPGVAEAAVIGLPHPKWSERPFLVIVAKEGMRPEKSELLDFLKDKVAKWAMPDDVAFVDQLPHTATGKILKSKLREDFREHRLPQTG
jgi:fatty-acyl-CoA synthase